MFLVLHTSIQLSYCFTSLGNTSCCTQMLLMYVHVIASQLETSLQSKFSYHQECNFVYVCMYAYIYIYNKAVLLQPTKGYDVYSCTRTNIFIIISQITLSSSLVISYIIICNLQVFHFCKTQLMPCTCMALIYSQVYLNFIVCIVLIINVYMRTVQIRSSTRFLYCTVTPIPKIIIFIFCDKGRTI